MQVIRTIFALVNAHREAIRILVIYLFSTAIIFERSLVKGPFGIAT